MAAENSLALNRFGIRFLDQETEADYRRWRNNLILPLFRLAALMSIVSWTTVPAASLLTSPGLFGPVELGLAYGFAVPLLALGLWGSFGITRAWCVPIGAAVLGILGFIYVYWFALEVFRSVGGAVAGALVFSITANFIRLPALWSLAGTGPYMFMAGLAAILGHQNGQLAIGDAWGYASMTATAYLVIAGMGFINERLQRQSYINEQKVAAHRDSLERSRSLIRRYIPPKVAEQIISGNEAAIDAPTRRRVSMLFSDIAGFTDMADRVEPEVMTQVINEYMAAMSEIVDSHGGTVNEFMGDGLMAMYGAPVQQEPAEQAASAVRSAFAMQQRLPELNRQWRKLGLGEELRIRIGINTGMVSVGSYGSEGRMSYTAIGLQVNIAARIQSHCEPGSILISDASYHLVNETVACEYRGEVACKGVHYPVKVYAPNHPA